MTENPDKATVSENPYTSVVEAARAEVLAQGYRSTDMAKAMKALWGEFWFETAPDAYQGLPANPDYGRTQIRVTDEMVARGADALWREKAWAVSRDEVRIILLAALAPDPDAARVAAAAALNPPEEST